MSSKNLDTNFTFVDLFCGIGGFHQALASYGGRCVFACDIDEQCRKVYSQNFCTENEFPVEGDIRISIKNNSIPPFQFLCAGFPCQTFSKAGKRNGFSVVKRSNGEIDKRGQLFFSIIKLLKNHPECNYVLLENVRNLSDNKENWKIICHQLKKLGFIISEEPIIESPHHFGVPQIRERVYILGIRKTHLDQRRSLPDGFITRRTIHLDDYYKPCKTDTSNIKIILDKQPNATYFVSDTINDVLQAWEELRMNTTGLSHPFWLRYAGTGIKDRKTFYNSISFKNMPLWKQKIVSRIRDYYERNRVYIDKWIVRHKMLEKTQLHQKFEWNAGNLFNMQECIIQVRQSGIRVKRPNYFPSLVAMNNTSIIWDVSANHYRFLSPKECAKLQSFRGNYKFSNIDSITYRQLGNSVNVKVLSILVKELIQLGKKNK